VTTDVKWSNSVSCRKGKALCKRPFVLHRQQPEKYKENVDIYLHGKITADAHTKEAWGHSNKSLPITAVRNTAKRSFSKLRLVKTFHRSTMTDEWLTNLAMISIESETAKILDMTELTKTFAFLKTWKSHFITNVVSKCLGLSALYVVLMLWKMQGRIQPVRGPTPTHL